MSEKYYGKYRGTVINNIDPMQQARLLVQASDVLGVGISSWAMPCVPVAGIQMGVYVLPVIGASVWVEFESGDANHPIWTGGFWGSAAEVPPLALAGIPGDPNMVMQTQGMYTLLLSDLAAGPVGGIMLKSPTGAFITVNDTGIYIDNGKGANITMIGPSVNINMGALTII